MMLTIKTGAIRQISSPGTLVFSDGYFGAAASWSSNGSRIAFAATDAAGDVTRMRAYVVGAAGGSPVAISQAFNFLTTAKWSPNGTWIAFDRPASGSDHDLFLIHPDGSGEVNLTTNFEPGICCARWSPDSSALVAAGTVSGDDQSYLFIVPIDGGTIHQVTTVPAMYTDYSWGPAAR